MSTHACLAASKSSGCHMGDCRQWAELLIDTFKLAEQLLSGLAYASSALTRTTNVHSIRPVAVMLSCCDMRHSLPAPVCMVFSCCPGCL